MNVHPNLLSLSALEPGAAARVAALEGDAATRRRLLEMGFLRGERLVIHKVAPLGDPVELVIKGYHLSLRREEGACILVEREA